MMIFSVFGVIMEKCQAIENEVRGEANDDNRENSSYGVHRPREFERLRKEVKESDREYRSRAEAEN
jgi:hypothetical protein